MKSLRTSKKHPHNSRCNVNVASKLAFGKPAPVNQQQLLLLSIAMMDAGHVPVFIGLLVSVLVAVASVVAPQPVWDLLVLTILGAGMSVHLWLVIVACASWCKVRQSAKPSVFDSRAFGCWQNDFTAHLTDSSTSGSRQ
jgi:hypothetical protein